MTERATGVYAIPNTKTGCFDVSIFKLCNLDARTRRDRSH
jgi:hypothetical protein